MKIYSTIFVLSFTLILLLISFIAHANTTNMSTYYPSPSGNYTKVHLVNANGGPDENSAGSNFCLETSNNPPAYDGAPTPSHAPYLNTGTIFADKTTGYLEICKSDGSVASYPGACFNRFGIAGTTASCPTNYSVVNSTGFSMDNTNSIVSWSCCFSGPSTTSIARSGCFSIYSSFSPPAAAIPPAACNDPVQGDPNAYDTGCDTIVDTNITFRRNCCFNDPLGSNTLGVPSTCYSFIYQVAPDAISCPSAAGCICTQAGLVTTNTCSFSMCSTAIITTIPIAAATGPKAYATSPAVVPAVLGDGCVNNGAEPNQLCEIQGNYYKVGPCTWPNICGTPGHCTVYPYPGSCDCNPGDTNDSCGVCNGDGCDEDGCGRCCSDPSYGNSCGPTGNPTGP